jgi:hypothetical protein
MLRVVKRRNGSFDVTLEYWVPSVEDSLADEIGRLLSEILSTIVEAEANY